MPISMPVAMLIAGAAGAGTQVATGIYGSKQAAKANKEAGDLQAKATADQLAFQREQEATRKAEYDAQQAAAKEAWNAEQARRAPYREAAQNALLRLSSITGLPAPTSTVAPPSATPPPGWTPGSTSSSGSMVPMSSMLPSGGTDAAVQSYVNAPRRTALTSTPAASSFDPAAWAQYANWQRPGNLVGDATMTTAGMA